MTDDWPKITDLENPPADELIGTQEAQYGDAVEDPDPQHHDEADHYAAETDDEADFEPPKGTDDDPGEVPSEIPDAEES